MADNKKVNLIRQSDNNLPIDRKDAMLLIKIIKTFDPKSKIEPSWFLLKGDHTNDSDNKAFNESKKPDIQDRADAINAFAKLVKKGTIEEIYTEFESIRDFPEETAISSDEATKILKKYNKYEAVLDHAKARDEDDNDLDPAGGRGLDSHVEEGKDILDVAKYIDLAAQYTDEDLTQVAGQTFHNAYEIINIIKDYIPQSKQKEFVERAKQLDKPINESGKINQPGYEFYVYSNEQNKIISGWEYKEDADDFIHELSDEFLKQGIVVMTKRSLKAKGLDPDKNEDWGTDHTKESLNESKESKTLDADHVIWEEYQRGIKYELEKQGDLDLDKAMKKSLANLNKDNLFYTRLISGQKLEKNRKDVMEPLNKKQDYLKAKNQMEKLDNKKVTSNVKDTLGNKEKGKKKGGKKIKIMSVAPKKQKGVKVMDLPGKEKKIKLKESRDYTKLSGLSYDEFINIITDDLVENMSFTPEEATTFIQHNIENFKTAYEGNNDPREAIEVVFSFSTSVNEKEVKEDIYSNTKTGTVQSFNPNDPTDKKTLNDPKFRSLYKKQM